MSKTVSITVALIGLAIAIAVVIGFGTNKILHAVVAIGWRGLLVVVLWQLAVFVLLGVAWWVLCPGVSLATVIGGRLVREGGERCLPFSEIGGLVLGARVLVMGGAGFAPAAASSVVDVVAETISLVPFLGFGLLVLARKSDSSVWVPIAIGLAVIVLSLVLGFVFRRRVARLFRVGVTWLLSHWTRNAPQCADELQGEIEKSFLHRRRVASASVIHLLCWCGGGGNIWIAYHLLGARISLVDALAIEGMLSAVLGVGLLVPAGLGVQELSYMAFGTALGIAPHLSLSLSLIRRARDILIGAPSLGIWELLEARRLRRG